MSKIYFDTNGAPLALWDTDADPFGGTTPPVGTVSTLDFDAADNPALEEVVLDNWNQITYVGAVLKNGAVVVPVLPSQALARTHAAATAILSDLGPEGIVLRAILLLVLDQLNLVRTQPSAVFAALTPAQARTGVINKIAAGLANA